MAVTHTVHYITNTKLTPSLRSRSPTIFKAEIRAAGVIGERGICKSAKRTNKQSHNNTDYLILALIDYEI